MAKNRLNPQLDGKHKMKRKKWNALLHSCLTKRKKNTRSISISVLRSHVACTWTDNGYGRIYVWTNSDWPNLCNNETGPQHINWMATHSWPIKNATLRFIWIFIYSTQALAHINTHFGEYSESLTNFMKLVGAVEWIQNLIF